MTARLIITCDHPQCPAQRPLGGVFTNPGSVSTARGVAKQIDGWNSTSVKNPFFDEHPGDAQRIKLDRCPEHATVPLRVVDVDEATYTIEVRS